MELKTQKLYASPHYRVLRLEAELFFLASSKNLYDSVLEDLNVDDETDMGNDW